MTEERRIVQIDMEIAWNEAEELNCSLRELGTSELIGCRAALIERSEKIMDLLGRHVKSDMSETNPGFLDTEPNDDGSVDIIASGYEWMCPNCEAFNRIAEIPSDEKVECDACHKAFPMSDYHHAQK